MEPKTDNITKATISDELNYLLDNIKALIESEIQLGEAIAPVRIIGVPIQKQELTEGAEVETQHSKLYNMVKAAQEKVYEASDIIKFYLDDLEL